VGLWSGDRRGVVEYVFVSNGHSDCVTVIDAKTLNKRNEIFLSPEPRLKNLRGLIPFGLAISPDQKRLYVAEAGINAVGIIDVPTQRVIGHLPTGWFPSKLQVSRDGKKLLVANAKGFGSGPNGGSSFAIGSEGSYIGNLMKGTVSVMTIPTDDALPAETQQVVRNNFRIRPADDKAFAARKNNPVPLYPSAKNETPIKHIVFILKENRTYVGHLHRQCPRRHDPVHRCRRHPLHPRWHRTNAPVGPVQKPH
jgi:YVTN family beta-propeller protein